MFLRPCGRAAFTLIEVIASLMLLSTLLVAILIANQRHAQQIRSAQERLAAIAAAEGIFAEWNAKDQWGAVALEGPVKDHPEFTWRWELREPPELLQFGAAIGRLEIISKEGVLLAAIEVLTAGSPIQPLRQTATNP
jgi:prepilin-type N-terminal cleavage/methylation domain-containing protein